MTHSPTDIVMKTFIGDSGNYEDIPLSKVLEFMTDDWIDDEITLENISELRDACKTLLQEVDRLKQEVERLKDLARQIVQVNQSDCVHTISERVARLAEAAQQLLEGER